MRKGFSLLELVIVLAIILIIAAFALPNPSVMQAYFNQRSAHSNVDTARQVYNALQVCSANHDGSAGCTALASQVPVTGTVGGYSYVFSPAPAFQYSAAPVSGVGVAYYTDSTGLLRCASGVATSSSAICN